MSIILDEETPVLLGLADYIEAHRVPFPIGGLDLFQLSQHKLHIIYPGTISTKEWVILVSHEFLKNCDLAKWQLKILDENKIELANVNFHGKAEFQNIKENNKLDREEGAIVAITKESSFTIIHFKVDSIVTHPGRYTVFSIYDGVSKPIGVVHFHYKKAQNLIPDQIKAIESDPSSAKAIKMTLGCKNCSFKLIVYTGLKRQPDLENEGVIWYSDLEDEFKCECGNTNYSLTYLKESMHGLLMKDFSMEISGLSYIRRYGHSQVVKIVKKFTALLDGTKDEKPIQEFIENNLILLSRFHAKLLFVKPSIVGRFEADFAVLDTQNQLIFIELEKPTMKLFKKDKHPTAALWHAYGQVNDWLEQYSKYPGAILDSLNLKADQVATVRGAVIAGRNNSLMHDVIQRHLSNPPFQNIEFMTLDELGRSLMTISKKLA